MPAEEDLTVGFVLPVSVPDDMAEDIARLENNMRNNPPFTLIADSEADVHVIGNMNLVLGIEVAISGFSQPKAKT